MAVARYILGFVSNGTWATVAPPLWTPTVGPSYGRAEPLPPDAERQALQRGVQFYRNARLLPDPKRATDLGMLFGLPEASQPDALRKYARLVPPYATNASGDGRWNTRKNNILLTHREHQNKK